MTTLSPIDFALPIPGPMTRLSSELTKTINQNYS